jgi:hypothetical protein
MSTYNFQFPMSFSRTFPTVMGSGCDPVANIDLKGSFASHGFAKRRSYRQPSHYEVSEALSPWAGIIPKYDDSDPALIPCSYREIDSWKSRRSSRNKVIKTRPVGSVRRFLSRLDNCVLDLGLDLKIPRYYVTYILNWFDDMNDEAYELHTGLLKRLQ